MGRNGNNPINRFVIQYTWGDGYLRWESGPKRVEPLTPAQLVQTLRETADLIEKCETRRNTKVETDART